MIKINGRPGVKKNKKLSGKPNRQNVGAPNLGVAQSNYVAIDLGTNSCRLVVATPTTTSFRVVETYSKVVRLGEGIIQDNELSMKAMRRTLQALKVCSDQFL